MAGKLIIKPEDIRLETERLIMRPLMEKDSQSLYDNVKDYDIAKWTINIPHPYPEDGAISFIKKSIESMQKGRTYDFAIILKDSSELVGVMDFIYINWKHRNAELGYWVGKKYWNKGIATEAAAKMMDFGFQELNLERICARCFHNNDASKRVMEKVGMSYEGRFRNEVLKENTFLDMIYFGIIKEDWSKRM